MVILKVCVCVCVCRVPVCTNEDSSDVKITICSVINTRMKSFELI
jgi:hypothetical protein